MAPRDPQRDDRLTLNGDSHDVASQILVQNQTTVVREITPVSDTKPPESTTRLLVLCRKFEICRRDNKYHYLQY